MVSPGERLSVDGGRLRESEPLQTDGRAQVSWELSCVSAGSSLSPSLLFLTNQWGLEMPCRGHSAGPGKASGPECWSEGVLAVATPWLLRHLHAHPKPPRSHGLHSQRLPLLWTWPICLYQRPVQASPSSQSVSQPCSPLSQCLGDSHGLTYADPLHVYSV